MCLFNQRHSVWKIILSFYSSKNRSTIRLASRRRSVKQIFSWDAIYQLKCGKTFILVYFVTNFMKKYRIFISGSSGHFLVLGMFKGRVRYNFAGLSFIPKRTHFPSLRKLFLFLKKSIFKFSDIQMP